MSIPKQNKHKIIVIVGPTASGKSDLGVELALKHGGEVISADSRQVYKGMDIGSGKITKSEMKGVPHHLLDVVQPKTDYNVSKFKHDASKKISEIVKRGKLPIIVGGTAFWIDAVVYGMDLPEVKPNSKLRAKLERERPSELFEKLKKLDPQRALTIEPKNKRRLVRALEIVMLTNKPVPKHPIPNSNGGRGAKDSPYDVKWFGIKIPQDRLERRIKKRLIERLDEGMVKEIKKLHKPASAGGSGVSWRRLDDFGLEYRYVSRMLRGIINYAEMIRQLETAIIKYSKRQMTWWKRNKDIEWISKSKIELERIVV